MKNKQTPKNDKPAVDSDNRSSGHRLAVGDVLRFNKQEHVVWFINDSRAAIAPLNSAIKWRVREADGKIQFLAQDSENISPNSDCEILRSLGRKGLAEYLETKNQNQSSDMAKNKTKTEKTKTEKTENRPGKLGGYKGHSITSVIRAFGKAGWTLDEARAFFAKKEIAVADTTIKIQLRAGSKGEGGDPAAFTKDELAAMRPKNVKSSKPAKSEDKPAKKGKKGKSKPAADEEEEEAEEEEAPAAAEEEEGEGEEE